MKRYVKAASDAEILKQNGIDPSKFNSFQMVEIRAGLKEGLDVSWYADTEFDDSQMYAIRLGLEEGVDVSQYADPKYDYLQMEQIRLGLEGGIDVSQYADPKYDYDQMREIRLSLEGVKPPTLQPSTRSALTGEEDKTVMFADDDELEDFCDALGNTSIGCRPAYDAVGFLPEGRPITVEELADNIYHEVKISGFFDIPRNEEYEWWEDTYNSVVKALKSIGKL